MSAGLSAHEAARHSLEQAVFSDRQQDLKLSPIHVAQDHRQLSVDLDGRARRAELQVRDVAVHGGKEGASGLYYEVSAVSLSVGVAESCVTADADSCPTVKCVDRLGNAAFAPQFPYAAKKRLNHDREADDGEQDFPEGISLDRACTVIMPHAVEP